MSLGLFSCSLPPLQHLGSGPIPACLECFTGFSIPLPAISIAPPFLHFQSIFLTVTRYKVNIYIRVKPTFILCFCVSGTDLENWHILSVILTIYIVTPIFHQRKLSFIDVISGWLCAWSLLGWVNCIFFQDSAQRISSSVSSLLSENSASDFVYCIL